MKATGIVRRTDELGRVVIPKELRRTFDIKEKDPIEIFVRGETVIMRKYQPKETVEGKVKALVAEYGEEVVMSMLNELEEKYQTHAPT